MQFCFKLVFFKPQASTREMWERLGERAGDVCCVVTNIARVAGMPLLRQEGVRRRERGCVRVCACAYARVRASAHLVSA